MSDDAENQSDDETHLNAKAFGAVLGLSKDWRKDLIELLRSEAPIWPAVREQLADVLEGKSNIAIAMTGHSRASARTAGLTTRQQWHRDGESVVTYIAQHRTVDDAFSAASEDQGKDDDYWRKKYYYYRRCEDWLLSARKTGTFYSKMHPEELRQVWHFASYDQETENPTPPSAAEFDEVRLKRVQFFSDIFRSTRQHHLAVDVFVAYSEILPADND